MSIDEWWPKLAPETQRWLIAHNGEPLPADVLSAIDGADEVNAATRGLTAELTLPDADIDWIEAVANDEDPADEG